MTEVIERLMKEVDELLETREVAEDVWLSLQEAEEFRAKEYQLEPNPARYYTSIWTSYNISKAKKG